MGSFTGDPSDLMHRSTYQTLTTKGSVDATIRYGIWNKNSFTQALGVEAYGATAMTNVTSFAKGKSNGRIIIHKGGSYMSSQIFEQEGTSQFGGRMASFTPELVEGGKEWAYSHHLLFSSRFVPELDIQDNAGEGKLIDILALNMDNIKKTVARDINLALLGNTAGPDHGVSGPSAMNTSIAAAIGVTPATVGGIDQDSEATVAGSAVKYWSPTRKAITDIGGGGEFDRPLLLRRALVKNMNDASAYAEQRNDYLNLCTQGAYEYLDRLYYADSIQGQRKESMGKKGTYDAAGVEHVVFNGSPFVWDTAVADPIGATTDAEAITHINIPNYKICFHTQEGLTMDGWEKPRLHDQQRTYVAQFRARFTPMFTAFRPHALSYNMPENTD